MDLLWLKFLLVRIAAVQKLYSEEMKVCQQFGQVCYSDSFNEI